MSAKRKKTIYDGFFYKNPVLIGGLIAGPVIVCADTLAHALVLCLMFSMLSFISVMLSSFVPRRLVYGLRIIVYSLIATLVYVPLSQVCAEYFPLEFEAMGIYLPLLTVSSLITTQTEFLFNRQDGVYAEVSWKDGKALVLSKDPLPELVIRKTIMGLDYTVEAISEEH